MRCVAVIVAALLPGLVAAGTRDEELLSAIRAGDYAGAHRLLAAHTASPDQLLPDGSTPLSWAVETQDPRMVKVLLDAKAKVDAAPNAAAAPLLLACEHGGSAVLGLLLDAGANVKRARPDGITALALCAGNAPTDIVQRLLAGGAEVDGADAGGQTALMWAASHGRVATIHLLLAHGAGVNRETTHGFTPLFFALKSGSPQASLAILDAGGDPDHVAPDGTTAVQLAMYQGDYTFAARMISRKADLATPDRNGNTLLHAAVLAEQTDLVKLLLAKGADPNALTGHSVVQWRYESNFKTSAYEEIPASPLLLAAKTGNPGIMQLLVAAGADPKFRSQDGSSILHAAVAGGHAAAVATALQLLPDPNVTDGGGRTPLHLLLADDPGPESDAILKLLAQNGARTDIRDHKGITAAVLVGEAPASLQASYTAAFDKKTARL